MTSLARRAFFPILPAAAAGCFHCPAAALQPTDNPSAARADLTWEQIFRFAYQKDFIPLMNGIAAKLGREKFLAIVRETLCEIAAQKMKQAPIPDRSFAVFRENMRHMPPLYRAALQNETLQDSAEALEYKVHACLWARMFVEAKAGDLGDACICAADFAIASAFNPRLKLERDKTLMQGHDCCHFRYRMEA